MSNNIQTYIMHLRDVAETVVKRRHETVNCGICGGDDHDESCPFPAARDILLQPVPLLLFCPECQMQHVDEGEWATARRHRKHLCQGCGHVWKPYPFDTVGVKQ